MKIPHPAKFSRSKPSQCLSSVPCRCLGFLFCPSSSIIKKVTCASALPWSASMKRAAICLFPIKGMSELSGQKAAPLVKFDSIALQLLLFIDKLLIDCYDSVGFKVSFSKAHWWLSLGHYKWFSVLVSSAWRSIHSEEWYCYAAEDKESTRRQWRFSSGPREMDLYMAAMFLVLLSW